MVHGSGPGKGDLVSGISRRKSEHLNIVSEREVEHRGGTLLEDVHLLHEALPELDVEDVDTTTEFFGRRLSAPLMITSMTGGAEFAERLNHGLAGVAAEKGIAFAVGSQRVMLRHPEVISHFDVRRNIPDGVLLGNIGAVQLLEHSTEAVAGLVEAIEADGLCVHLNTAQELVQAEGNRRFRGLLDGIARLLDRLDGRVLVKETGAGLSPGTLERLAAIGVRYVDVSGSGGTSWTRVESYRASNGPLKNVGETLGDWGIPTAVSTLAARSILGEEGCIVASGGIRHGLDIARALALGADLAGVARPALLAFLKGGRQAAMEYITMLITELRTVMVLTESGVAADLRNAPRVITGRLRQWCSALGLSVE